MIEDENNEEEDKKFKRIDISGFSANSFRENSDFIDEIKTLALNISNGRIKIDQDE